MFMSNLLGRSGPARQKLLLFGMTALLAFLSAMPASASEADLVLPDFRSVSFLGITGFDLLLGGLVVCVLGMLFGLMMYIQLKNLPVHQSMREISELIYETCKTYLVTQGKFILHARAASSARSSSSTSACLRDFALIKVIVILLFSLVGIAGSYGVAWFGIRVNTFANSRTAFACLRGKPSGRTPSRSRPACRSACS